MKHFSYKRRNKIIILLGAITIGLFSYFYTKSLVEELKLEEQKKVELWAEATRQLVKPDMENNSIGLTLEVLKNNTTVPVMLTDAEHKIHHYRNIDVPNNNKENFLKKKLQEFIKNGKRIRIDLGDGEYQYLYYETSTLLTKLTWFPMIQLFIISIFVFIAYLAFSNSRKAEQNQVWVGLAKETAHQLGTPISSMLGWIDYLSLKLPGDESIDEIKKDVSRLQNITERFSKIGSKQDLQIVDLSKIIDNTITYLKKRSSAHVKFNVQNTKNIFALGNITLLEWVFENIIKNAIDAIKGDGTIWINLQESDENIELDISDNGVGINRSNFKTVFEPGYTTKKRGWGLGLSLTKRIIEEYHKGKIFVKESTPNTKTTFRIILNKTNNAKKIK